MKKKIFVIACLLGFSPLLFSFCGFYVSKADGTLKNKTSQVILVRDGNKSVVTMYNDFVGNSADFAMVVPVPVVLKKADIKVVDPSIFQKLNDYSAPRLVEYWDENPCERRRYEAEDAVASAPSMEMKSMKDEMDKEMNVTVEAQYLVGEYDILILSAKESGGLKTWLNLNGYKIPNGAEEVLAPYIKDNMKFFVVKVNEKEKKKLNNNFLSPIQISFSSPKFMLPIRLGMANADGNQDLIVYALTRKGRVQNTNYRNVEMPTDKNIPLFVQDNFGGFYGNLFHKQWKNERENISFLEYAWDLTPINPMKCDPCVGNPPTEQDLVQSGVWWLGSRNWNDYSDVDNVEVEENGKVFFTRLHYRYNRQSFPQDLSFQVTANTNTYQARYIITHPAEGNFSCSAGKIYLQKLKQRRKKELNELTSLTGTTLENWQEDMVNMEGENVDTLAGYAQLTKEVNEGKNEKRPVPYGIIFLGTAVFCATVITLKKGTA